MVGATWARVALSSLDLADEIRDSVHISTSATWRGTVGADTTVAEVLL